MVHGVEAAAVDLLLDGRVHYLVGVPQDDSTDAVDPIDEFVAVYIHESGPLGTLGVDRIDTVGNLTGAPYDLAGPLV